MRCTISQKANFFLSFCTILGDLLKAVPKDVFVKRISANMQQINRKTSMWKCNFKKVATQNTLFKENLPWAVSGVLTKKLFVCYILQDAALANCLA